MFVPAVCSVWVKAGLRTASTETRVSRNETGCSQSSGRSGSFSGSALAGSVCGTSKRDK